MKVTITYSGLNDNNDSLTLVFIIVIHLQIVLVKFLSYNTAQPTQRKLTSPWINYPSTELMEE